MSYELAFHEVALKEWKHLDASIKTQFKKQLAKRLQNPHIPSARLRGLEMQNIYKIKLWEAGYRLVYEVDDQTVRVLVLAVGRRDKNQAYRHISQRRELPSSS